MDGQHRDSNPQKEKLVPRLESIQHNSSKSKLVLCWKPALVSKPNRKPSWGLDCHLEIVGIFTKSQHKYPSQKISTYIMN